MKYIIKIPVYNTINVMIETDSTSEEEIKEMAIEKAIEETPLVDWLVDEIVEIEKVKQ